MRISSGSINRYIYFVAVDATDLKTREVSLATFTVWRSRNGAAAVAMTTPTINETNVSNMPGVYELLLDEDTTLAAGNDTEEMVIHITHAGMAPVTRVVELYRETKPVADIFVDTDAVGAANGYDRHNAFTTIAAAIAVAETGDTIRIADGTYSEAVVSTVDNLTFIGESRSGTIITVATGVAMVVTGEHTTIRNLKILSTTLDDNTCVGVQASADNCTIEDCWVDGAYEGVMGGSYSGLIVRGCDIYSDFDSLGLGYNSLYLIENCEITTRSNWDVNDREQRALYCPNSHGTVRNSTILATRNIASAGPRECIAIAGSGTLVLEGMNKITATGSGSFTGDVIGIGEVDVGTDPFHVFMHGGWIAATSPGGGTAYDCKTTASQSTTQLSGVYSPGTHSGNVFVVSPTAAENNTAVEGGVIGTDTGTTIPALVASRVPTTELVIESGSTVSTVNVTAPTGITSTLVDDALVVTNTVGRVKGWVRVTSVTGSPPTLALAVTPNLPETPQVGDTLLLGPKYLDTSAL